MPPERAARLRLAPSSSIGAVTATGGGLPVVRFALRRRRRGLLEARFPRGVGVCRGPQRPRCGGARPLVGDGGSGNCGVLPPARRWFAAAPLQDFRSSAAAPQDQARPNRRPSSRRRATRVFACPRRRQPARCRRRGEALPPSVSRCDGGGAGSARRAFPVAWGGFGGRNAPGVGAHRPWRATAAAATAGCFHRRGAGSRRRRCKIFGPLRRRRRIKRGAIGGRVASSARHASAPAPLVVDGRGDGDWGRSSRRPIRAATAAARAPRGARFPWRRGMSGAATPSVWGRTAPGGGRRRRQLRGASAGAALVRGGADPGITVLCGGAAASSAVQSAADLAPSRHARHRLRLL